MWGKLRWSNWGVGVTAVATMLGAAVAQAGLPTSDEVYRSDRLKMIVFKDSQPESNVLWYLPPIKLYEENGKVVFTRREKGGKIDFYFHVQPYMTEGLVEMLAGEIPRLTNRAQLKPVKA